MSAALVETNTGEEEFIWYKNDPIMVKLEDVEREMISIPDITIVETEGYDPRERYLVEMNGNFMGSYSDLERADARVTELKRILNI